MKSELNRKLLSKFFSKKDEVKMYLALTNQDTLYKEYERLRGNGLTFLSRQECKNLARVGKYIFPTTICSLEEELFLLQRYRKEKWRDDTSPLDSTRLYPLSETKYQEFAEYVYNKKGKPKHGVQIITGVKWGHGQVTTNGRWGRYKRILERWVGVCLASEYDPSFKNHPGFKEHLILDIPR